jgi:NAD(P)H-hydrate epimerase
MFNDEFKNVLSRPTRSNKYTFGHVLVIGGSKGMVGAPMLVGKASLRTGAGLVSIASDKYVTNTIGGLVPEIMTLSISKRASAAFKQIIKYIQDRHIKVIVIGNGMSLTNTNYSLIRKIVESIDIPIIIDGGGISLIGKNDDSFFKELSDKIILTPHLGEFRKLIKQDLPEDYDELVALAKKFSKNNKVSLIVKGYPSFFVNGDFIYKNNSGNPGLATAGTGDVLAGILAGLISQSLDLEKAVPMAIYLHGLAGDIATKKYTQPGVIASDVVNFIPVAYQQIANATNNIDY